MSMTKSMVLPANRFVRGAEPTSQWKMCANGETDGKLPMRAKQSMGTMRMVRIYSESDELAAAAIRNVLRTNGITALRH